MGPSALLLWVDRRPEARTKVLKRFGNDDGRIDEVRGEDEWTESGDCLFFSIRGVGTLIPGSRPLKSALSPPSVFSIRGAGTLIPGSRPLKSRVDVYFFFGAGGFSSLLCFARMNCSSLLYSSALRLSRLSCGPLSCFGALRCLFLGVSLGLS
jgi:hypothetical protein